jgi:GTP-binding protein HflX
LHVIDAGNPYWERQRSSVETILRDLGAGAKPALIAWNKIDLAGGRVPTGDGVAVSAKTGEGLSALKAAIAQRLSKSLEREVPGGGE